MNKEIKNIAKTLKKANKIALFTHISPDCDALGSTYALYYALKQLGKKVDVYTKEAFTVVEKILFDESIIKKTACKSKEYDIFVACDVPSYFRLGEYEKNFHEKDNFVVIDHHQNAGLVGEYNYIDPTRSSCCELMLDVIKKLKVKVNKEIASCLYVGLSSDTTSFVNSNTNSKSFQTASELITYGADVCALNETLYHTRTKKSIDFKRYLWNNFKIKGDCAYCLMPYEDLVALKGKKSDCDGYSTSLVSIQGVNYSFSIVEEKEGYFSVSMRSKIGYDVRSKAELLGGGGHLCAAGVKFKAKDMEEAKNKVLSTIKKED